MPRNARLFVAFRVLFNARFYYPVLAVLFVDLGLTLDQYALLNVAWAVSIVAFELPLGALGDQIGRKPLIVGAAALMVVEMAVLAFAPTGNPTLLFYVFLLNRVLSGLAEAAASGADEALAYDTMVEAGRKSEWPDVLAILTRRMSVAFVLSMVIGGAVYDPALMRRVFGAIGLDLDLTQQATARFPVYLTLLLALGALYTAVRMTEPGEHAATTPSLRENVRGIARAGGWILRTRFALRLVLFSLVFDTSVRLFMTLTSAYFRLLAIPAAFFGVISAGTGALGLIAPSLAQRLIKRVGPAANFAIVFALTLLGLGLAAWIRAWWGLVSVVFLSLGMHLLTFFGSHYLNDITESKQRATVLSFRSLANNIAYGGAGWTFALLVKRVPFGEALVWLPAGLVVLGLPLLLWSMLCRDDREGPKP